MCIRFRQLTHEQFSARIKRHQYGATLVEFVILTILILIFITVTINRIWDLRIVAERNSVESLIGTLRSALGIEISTSVLRKSGSRSLSSYNHSNPMDLLDPKYIPSNYLGEYPAEPAEPIPGEWYFNKHDATLEYRLLFPDSIENSNTKDPALLKFQVQLQYVDSNNNRKYDANIDTASGIEIASLQIYHWKRLRSE